MIARVLAEAIRESETATLLAVGSRKDETAEEFGEKYGAERRYGHYDALLQDPDIDAVYISLPNHLHREWTVKAAAAGKHILCEKPLGMNAEEVEAMIAAVRQHDVFFLEAFMYRCSPQTAKLVELVREKAIGEVRMIQATFCYRMGPKYENIRLQNEAGGGGIMDVGCYTMSMARLIAGAAHGKDFADPISVRGAGHIGEVSRVDEWAMATVAFEGGITANLVCATQVSVPNGVSIWGTEGNLQVPTPWFPGRKAGEEMSFVLHRDGKEPETILLPGGPGLYTREVDLVEQYYDRREAPSPAMTWADSLGQQKALDAWRREIGLRFDTD
ncbi:MAG: Gfo/Idh/MocA family oxidoreductase [Bacteroidia bacterium]|nr:Gfo/Idh/MocA family oxidoreductase [Bacteroidia bacterium]